ncbi:glycoside hydrolase family 10 protein [Spirillospora sp. NBC_01491]|uniref:glycoside hydrolase family 10 protein n=1 Tax=Spirillospora sp. NBC_01491 TaxID=2976007 RepID=UPI002E353684|nr:family 10 glycosylhydrolase [Spirillospora sp. NBC_01491]
MAWRAGTVIRVLAAATSAAVLAACGGGDGHGGEPAAAPGGARAECAAVAAPGDSRSRELRGMWIATVAGIDWPKSPSKERQQAGFRKLLDTAQAMNLNAVFVQIRPNSDAFYPSPHEPWSQWITGKQGKDPGYDVLGFMLKEAHARNLEFHAWFNPYRVSRQSDLGKLAPGSPARKHPDWVRKYGTGLWYDPGLPQVRDLATKAVMDVVGKYDIDAVHFDDYFYPYPEGAADYPDKATYKAHGRGMDKADWRRQNVDTLVRTLSEQIHRAKPWMRFGISPFGVWRNKTTDPKGSATKALESYDAQYADTLKWIKQGWIDYVTPQLYWAVGDARADYATLVDWWSRQVAGTRVQLSIGQAAYRVGEDATWKKPAELGRHLDLNRRHPAVRGDVYFSAADLASNRRGFAQRLRDDHYPRPAIPPVVQGRGGQAPAPARGLRAGPAAGGAKGVQVQWRPAGDATAYGVYRVDGKAPACAAVDPARLVAAVRGGGIVDPSARPGRTYTYYVTALDRLHHESAPGRGATVTAPRG